MVDTAIAAGSFTTLVEAVKAAGLVDTLRGEGPFTVFAPTDEAFSKVPQDQLNALLQDKEKLTSVLTYHVAPGKLPARDVVNRKAVKTVQGQSLTVRADDTGVRIDDAKVTKTDIIASNGVIHVIDTVVIPN
ncbi:MAG: fasciclin domain-containing protein [Gammaproteobacteria bacterium]|nr:fasciclin domain-containing protein [Gammaproteobacteria bacterium]